MVNEVLKPEVIKSVIDNLPPEVLGNITSLINIFKALGIIFIIYIMFLIAKGYFDIRRTLLLKKMNQNLNEINEKLSKLLELRNKRKK